MGDFFDATMGKIMKSATAHVSLKPKARAVIKEKLGCTDEELDEALKQMDEQMTEQAHADMDYLHKRGQAKQIADLDALIAMRKKEKASGRTGSAGKSQENAREQSSGSDSLR